MEPTFRQKLWAKIQKFGLEYDDFPTMIDNVAFLLRTLTINIQKTWTHRISFIFYILVATSIFCYCYAYFFSMAWLVYIRYGRKEIEASAVVFALTTCSCACITKFIFMKLHVNGVKDIIENFLICDSKVIKNTRFAKSLRQRLRIVKRRALVIWTSLVTDGSIYVGLPLIRSGRHFSVDLYLLYGLEPMFETPNYEIATFVMTMSTTFAAYSMVTIALYIIVTVGYTEAQMHALAEELRNVWNDSGNFYNHIKHRIEDKRQVLCIKRKIMNEFVRVRLRDIIKFHVTNIGLINDLNVEFRPTLAVESIIMAGSLITDLLGGLEHTFCALPYTMVMLVMNCLSGQRLIDACDDVESSLYSCQWESFDASNQRTVLLMLVMSQKTLMLSAGGVANFNYNTMMVILKSIYSTYTTLQSTIKKNK